MSSSRGTLPAIMRKITALLTLIVLIIGCSKNDRLTVNDILTSKMSSEGIGAIKIGDNFSDLLQIIPNHIMYTSGSESTFWDVVKIDLGNDEWIIIENENGALNWESLPSKSIDTSDSQYHHYRKNNYYNTIRAIRTNSKRIKTTLGIKIGMTINDAIAKGETIDLNSDLAGINFLFQKEDIIFHIEPKWERLYFSDGGEFPSCLNLNSKISELKIK
jgi:hypothetical protein